MKRFLGVLLVATVTTFVAQPALAQRDAGSKMRGEYNFYGGAAGHSLRSARQYSQSYREYLSTAPDRVVNPEVAREATDAIGEYIAKAQKHMAWMRKQAAGDKETLASLDLIDKNLAEALKAHTEMVEICSRNTISGDESLECCQRVDATLAKAIAEHDKLMKRIDKSVTAKK